MTIFLTVLSGVIVYVLGQLALKLVIEPGHEFKRTVADIAHALIMIDGVFVRTDQKKSEEVSAQLRELSARLYAHVYLINYITSLIFRVPTRKKLLNAMQELNRLSYIIGSPEALSKQPTEALSSLRDLVMALGIPHPLFKGPW